MNSPLLHWPRAWFWWIARERWWRVGIGRGRGWWRRHGMDLVLALTCKGRPTRTVVGPMQPASMDPSAICNLKSGQKDPSIIAMCPIQITMMVARCLSAYAASQAVTG